MRDPEDYSAVAVLIECPEAGSLVPTGIHAHTHDALESTNLLLDCPDCGQDHPWVPADAVLASAPALDRGTPSAASVHPTADDDSARPLADAHRR